MRTIEVVYIAAVVFFAACFAGVTLSRAGRVVGEIVAGEGAWGVGGGSAGKPRDVDLTRIRRLIREGKLSDHEAEFYKEIPSGAPNGSKPWDSRSRRSSGGESRK